MNKYCIKYKDMFGRINNYIMECTSKKKAKESFLKWVIFTEIIEVYQVKTE